MANSYPGTQSVLRAIRLLKLFGTEQAEWGLNELVETTGLNKTTVFRLLTALESEGLLERTETSLYRLGPEVVALGGRAMISNGLLQVAQPSLTQLTEATGERSTLEQAIQNTDGLYEMLILIEIPSKYRISISQYIGSRLPMHATSTGKTLLAFMTEDERQQVLDQHFYTLTPATITDKAEFIEELHMIRERGYAIAAGELETGLMAVGAPIYNHKRDAIAAVSVEGPDSRIDIATLHWLGEQLMETAQQISLRLGYRK